ncbi:MAG: indole-3-glycerol phosphate synthase TrpC [Gammaproteobacteria bacterium]|nr:indole-3-glycerol phosphate synthase TrpC [Gammaproteobacteria bacterium]MCG3144736.1 Indole-3-glycerol phosphate synthase [Gammaproteobacteria bacterium]
MDSTPDILKRILHHKEKEVAARRAVVSLEQMERRAEDAPPPRGFVTAIEHKIAEGKPAVIAECKKASPSKGIIRKEYYPAEIAKSYEAAGAACLSVLTDTGFFQGTDAHMQAARAACALPVLRKDFIVDPYQVYEARALGADCILLIVAGLKDRLMQDLAWLARDLGMDALVEVHNREELERGLMLRTPLIGINNRDLHTFHTDLQTTLDLLYDVMQDRTVVTESGIHTPEQVAMLRKRGVHAFLVGEVFMSAPDPGEKLKELFSL